MGQRRFVLWMFAVHGRTFGILAYVLFFMLNTNHAASQSVRILSPVFDFEYLEDSLCERSYIKSSITGTVRLSFDTPGWEQSHDGTAAVYVDEEFVGDAPLGEHELELEGLEEGWHSVYIVLRSQDGVELDRTAGAAPFHISSIDLSRFDLPDPAVVRAVQAGRVFSIAVLVVATGGYVRHVPRFAQSALALLCEGHHVTILVLSDVQPPTDDPRVRWLPIKAEPWPGPTLLKPWYALQHRAALQAFDFAFFLDVDVVFIRPVGLELLGGLVAVLHPGMFGKDRASFPYESNRSSFAYVAPHEGQHYFAGGFYGGETARFIRLLTYLEAGTRADLGAGVTAVHHDESLLNRLLLDAPPDRLLSPRYLGPDILRDPPYDTCGLQLPQDEVRVVHLEKCLEVEEASGRCESFERRELGGKRLPEDPLRLHCAAGGEETAGGTAGAEGGACRWVLRGAGEEEEEEEEEEEGATAGGEASSLVRELGAAGAEARGREVFDYYDAE